MEAEFNTNVPDKDERKEARRQRIEARHAEAAEGGGSKLLDDDASKFQGQQQIATSLVHLDKKKSSGIDDTTVIRVNADLRESRRRVSEEVAREERLAAIDAEREASMAENAAIEGKWGQLEGFKVPQDLHKAIEEQKKRCRAVLASKDELIAELHLALKTKDEEYVKTLKLQAEDIDELLQRMRREFRDLAEEYEVELESIEDAFLAERGEMLKQNKGEVEGFFEKRRLAELEYASVKQRREAAHMAEVEDLIVHDHEEYCKLKIKLETDIQTLEQQLEEMQATYQLNSEKLEYNYRVLTERDQENTATLQQLKRKQAKLKETLSTLMQKYHETEAKDRKRNEDLTEAYRAITKQYKDLQDKFRHFEVADNKRFDELWAMHEEETGACVAKVIQADELITTQQLGWDWQPPDLAKLRYNPGVQAQQQEETSRAATPGMITEGAIAEEPSAGLAAASLASANASGAGALGSEGSHLRVVSGAKMQAMMHLLIDEAQFLVDSKVRDAVDSMSAEEAELAQVESMLKSLGVESEAEVAALVDFFFPDRPLGEEDEDEEDGLDEKGTYDASAADARAVVAELAKIIQPERVIEAIKSFVDAKKLGEATGAPISAKPATAKSSPLPASGKEGSGGEVARPVDARREEREYWARASGVLGEERLAVWSQLEKALVQYNQVLDDRSSAVEEVADLQQKNAALKQLLNTYLGARVNEELIIPPNQTIQLA